MPWYVARNSHHPVVNHDEVLAGRDEAHLEADIILRIEIPRAGVTDHLAVPRLHEERSLPERLRELLQAKRCEEALAVLHRRFGIDLLCGQESADVDTSGVRRLGGHDVVDIAPVLRPHVAEQMRGDQAVRRHELRAVLLAQLRARVRMELEIEWANLRPEPFQFP